jgi:DNA-binding MarR family transcriptional regulator
VQRVAGCRSKEGAAVTDGTEAIRRLLIAAAGVRVTLARHLGLSVSDFNALDHVAQSQESGRQVGPTELAQHLGMTSASATVLVDRLETAGLLQRRPRADDRRRVLLEVTDRTREQIETHLGPALNEVHQLTESLTSAERDAVLTYLDRVCTALRSVSSAPGP